MHTTRYTYGILLVVFISLQMLLGASGVAGELGAEAAIEGLSRHQELDSCKRPRAPRHELLATTPAAPLNPLRHAPLPQGTPRHCIAVGGCQRQGFVRPRLDTGFQVICTVNTAISYFVVVYFDRQEHESHFVTHWFHRPNEFVGARILIFLLW